MYARARSLALVVLTSSGCLVFDEPLSDRNIDPDGDAGSMQGTDGSTDAVDGSTAGVDAGTDSGPASCVVASIVSYDDCAGPIVINEVDGSGNDFIEIYNRSDADVNISNYVITDDNAGTPAVAEGVVVPVGTVLEAHRYLYVWSNLSAPQPGIRTTDCLPGAPPPCMHSGWGISASGERVYMLDDALNLICTFQYPSAVFGGESFGRVVDGTATLCPTTPSPGEANTASTMR